MSDPTTDEVAQTLAEYERLAIGTGEFAGVDAPEFSHDGVTWTPFWIGDAHPQLARATVYRGAARHPITVVTAWGESVPTRDVSLPSDAMQWADLWESKPMKLFGAYTLRAAYRRGFRDAIGTRREPDEHEPTVPRPRTPEAPNVDYAAAITATGSLEDIEALHKRMRTARAVTPQLEVALRARRNELSAPPAPKPVPSPPKQQQGRRRRRAPRDTHLTNSVGDVLRQAMEGQS